MCYVYSINKGMVITAFYLLQNHSDTADAVHRKQNLTEWNTLLDYWLTLGICIKKIFLLAASNVR